MKIKTTFFCLILCLFSCHQKQETRIEKDYAVEEITINPDEKVVYTDCSFLIDTTYIECIPLETNDECLIAEAFRINLRDNKIFVFDRQSAAVFIFNRDGSYHAKVQNIGNGPGEYPPIVNDMVITDKYVAVLVPNIKKIMFYDFDGHYVKDISIDNRWAFSLFTFDDEKFYLVNAFDGGTGEKFNFFTVNADGDNESFLPFDKRDGKVRRGWGIERYHSIFKKEHAYVLIPSIDTIYQVTPDKDIIPKYSIHITKNQLPKEDREGPQDIAIRKSITTKSILGLQGILESERYLFLDFMNFVCVYDKQIKETINTTIFHKMADFANFNIIADRRSTIEDGQYLINHYDSFLYEYMKQALDSGKWECKSQKFENEFLKAFNSLKGEGDNPIVTIYKLK